jgi:hypothetical protein
MVDVMKVSRVEMEVDEGAIVRRRWNLCRRKGDRITD